MKIKTNTQHPISEEDSNPCGISTNFMLEHMEQVSKALKVIKHTNKCLKNWKKALDAGKKTQAEYDATVETAKRILKHNFWIACEWGMGMGQGDDGDWETRSDLHANDVVEDATK
jgi:hypothetical protein